VHRSGPRCTTQKFDTTAYRHATGNLERAAFFLKDARSMTAKHHDPRHDDETLFDGVATRKRYSPPGGPIKSAMWLSRRREDPSFPRPIYIGILPHFRLGELRRWEDGLPNTPPPSQVALGKAGPEVLRQARERKAQGQPPAKPTAKKPRSPKPLAAE
jgi:hypothetical protein